MTLGPVRWEQCAEKATVMLKVSQGGKTQTMPACNKCWDEAIESRIAILEAKPIASNNDYTIHQLCKE
jgi:hypothetical protein